MPKVTDTFEVEVTPLSDQERAYLIDWVADCESQWNDQAVWGQLERKALRFQEDLCLH